MIGSCKINYALLHRCHALLASLPASVSLSFLKLATFTSASAETLAIPPPPSLPSVELSGHA